MYKIMIKIYNYITGIIKKAKLKFSIDKQTIK